MQKTASAPAGPSQLFTLLYRIHGPQDWWPIAGRSPDIQRNHLAVPTQPEYRWEIMVGAVLTQNTSWSNVERALAQLRTAGVFSPEHIASLPVDELAMLIRSSGYYNQKARKLKLLAAACIEESWLDTTGPDYTRPVTTGTVMQSPAGYGIPQDSSPGRERLLEIWGIGPETADCILLYACGKPVFVIDAYTRRILARLYPDGLPPAESPDTGSTGHPPASPIDPHRARYRLLQAWFSARLEADTRLFNEYHALLVRHAVEFCRTKPLCGECPLGPQHQAICPGVSA
ncbi:endonuclease III domain-containing protein [Spirochaeta africana]|uniref:Putative endonuclease III-like protein n=1 Tax=Spirochaeta africana (strain ATCC 700263 / DSM 8902 / Z-7692) TaxID=889378 RepID=H9UG11_SPIAZ|nr:putative endonuclease III-like protein [Spirochaeta africana]AFG36454.1 putative endonuclease III-like protein [Spirochaeta africana DSM 8902]